MTYALLDGDVIAYRAAAGHMEVVDGFDGPEGPVYNTKQSIASALEMAETWTRAAGATTGLLCLSDPEGKNFRRVLFPGYKEGRGPKPPHYWKVVEALAAKYKTFHYPYLEADDVIGILATSPKLGGRCVMVSIDKDLEQIPAKLWNPLKDWRDEAKRRPLRARKINPFAANRAWFTQALTGDAVDKYPGLPGVGPVKAKTILSGSISEQEMWQAVLDAFLAADLKFEDALTQARVARILRREQFNKETGEITLWHPSTPELFVPEETATRSSSASTRQRKPREKAKSRKS